MTTAAGNEPTKVGKQPNGFRFYVEDDTGRRSIEYVVSTAKRTGDVYVTIGRGGQSKVSIHESGAVNWSLIYDLLPSAPYIPETGRHLAQWDQAQGRGQQPLFIWIASADLRLNEPIPSAKAHRIAAAPQGKANQIAFLLTAVAPPGSVTITPEPLWWTRLPNQRIFVIQVMTVDVTEQQANELAMHRHHAWLKSVEAGKSAKPFGLARITVDATGVSGLLEFTPSPSADPVPDLKHRWVPGTPGRPKTTRDGDE
jgi:hypothetical protein